jgi:rsbT co-antagonist protein RsbR
MTYSTSRADMVEVHTDRIERIRDLLAMISLGEFNPTQHLIPTDTGDEFSAFEETINLFARQLYESVRESEVALRRVEATRLELEEKLATIEHQRIAIRELSTPIIEVWESVLALPVVGELDGARAQDMTDGLLRKIAQGKARCVIIDVTGVGVIDTGTADHLLRMIAAARLLGAFCVTTGVSPSVAETLVAIGVELRGVKTCSTLRAGLEECFKFLRGEGTRTGRSVYEGSAR